MSTRRDFLLAASAALVAMPGSKVGASEAVRRSEGSGEKNPAEFLQRVAEVNVDLNVKKLTDQSEILRGLVAAGELEVKGAMYSVETGRVTFRE